MMLANARQHAQYLNAAPHRPPDFSRALGRGLHAPRLPCQLCPGAFSLGEGDLHPQLPALDARDNCRLKSLQFFSFLAFYPEPVSTALRQRTMTPTWQRY